MEYKPSKVGNIVHEYPKRIMMYLEDHRISKLLLTLQYSNMACWKIHQQQFKDSPVHISIYYSDFFHMFSMFPMFFPVFFLFNYGISHNCRRKSHRPRARPDSLPSQLLQERSHPQWCLPGSSDPIGISRWSAINITYNVAPLGIIMGYHGKIRYQWE